jgi:hypothetical protein
MAANFVAKPVALSIPSAYGFLLEPSLPALAVGLIVLLAWRERRTTDAGGAEVPGYERASLGALAALPVAAYGLAVLVTGAFASRYVLPSVFGLAALATIAGFEIVGPRGGIRPRLLVGVAAVGALVAVFGAEARESERFRPIATLTTPLRQVGPGPAVIVVTNPDDYLQLLYYGTAADRSRLMYVEARQNTAEEILRRLQPWAPIRVQELDTFWADGQARPVWLYGRPDDWLPIAIVRAFRTPVRIVYLDEQRYVGVVDGP